MAWNSFNTADYEGIMSETIVIDGYNSDKIRVYYSRPMGSGPYPGIVLIPHMPGWDEWLRETCNRFSRHGYAVACPNIYERVGHGTPTEVSAKARETGIVTDETVMGDTAASLSFLRCQTNANGKVGVIGMCSGGRHTFLAACTVPGFDCAVDCWGGVTNPGGDVPGVPSPIDYAPQLNIPLLGIFGNEDRWPSKEAVDDMEKVLKDLGKDYEFHRYDGAGHGIWYYDKPMYRQEQAMDSWEKALAFFDKHLKE